MICRGVVVYLDEETLWGRLAYAPDDNGRDAIDALSAALSVGARKTARGIQHDSFQTRRLLELEFHASCFVGGLSRSCDLPRGQLVDVYLNSDNRLVSVSYPRS